MAKLRDKVGQALCGVQTDCPENVVDNKIQYRWRNRGHKHSDITETDTMSSAEKYKWQSLYIYTYDGNQALELRKRGFVFPSAALSAYIMWSLSYGCELNFLVHIDVYTYPCIPRSNIHL